MIYNFCILPREKPVVSVTKSSPFPRNNYLSFLHVDFEIPFLQ